MDCGLTGLTFNDPSLCKPQFARECDLHYIIDSFMKTGRLPASCSVHTPSYQDAIDVPDDWQELQDRTIHIKQDFEQLPIDERLKFANDPLAWFTATHEQAKAPEAEPAKSPEAEPAKAPQAEPAKSPETTVA